MAQVLAKAVPAALKVRHYREVAGHERVASSRTLRVKAADLVAALTDPQQMQEQRPEVPKHAAAIETMTIIGEDKLRAGDQAIYEVLLSWSREREAENGEQVIPASHVRSFLAQGRRGDPLAHNDRLCDALERLSTTFIRYKVRDEAFWDRGTVPLVTARLREKLSDATTAIHYNFDPAVQRLMTSDRAVGWLELGVFPHFKNKYTPRLYQRMALRASYDEDCWKDWIVSPEELATSLGYSWGKQFRYFDFRKNALDPALAEIQAHSKKVHFLFHEPITESSGRGRPKVTQLRFTVTRRMDPHILSTKAGLLAMEEAVLLKTPDHIHPPKLLPSVAAFSRVYRRSDPRQRRGRSNDLPLPLDLLSAWWAALDEAIDGYDYKSGHPAPVRGVDIRDEMLMTLIADFGTDDAFAQWCGATRETGRFLKRLDGYVPRRPQADRGPADPAERREWFIDRAIKDARCRVNDQTEIAPGLFLPRKWEEGFVNVYCDAEIEPWYMLADDMGANFAVLAKALELMQVHVGKDGVSRSRLTNKQRRMTLRNMLRAATSRKPADKADDPTVAAVRDFGRLAKIAIAVVAHYKDAPQKQV